MAFWSKVKQSFGNFKTKIFSGSSRSNFAAGKTNEAHYIDKWGREWFLYRDPNDPTQTAYRVLQNGKVIKAGHTPNIGALDQNGMPIPVTVAPPVKPPVKPEKPPIIGGGGIIRKQKTGEQLYRSIYNEAIKFNFDYKYIDKIKRMSPGNLERMYMSSSILFEAYWEYDDLEDGPYGKRAGETKNGEVEAFIDEYERRFGVL